MFVTVTRPLRYEGLTFAAVMLEAGSVMIIGAALTVVLLAVVVWTVVAAVWFVWFWGAADAASELFAAPPDGFGLIVVVAVELVELLDDMMRIAAACSVPLRCAVIAWTSVPAGAMAIAMEKMIHMSL